MLDLSTLKQKIMELAEQTKDASESAQQIAAEANSRIVAGNVRTMTLLEVAALIDEAELGDTTLEGLGKEFKDDTMSKMTEEGVSAVLAEAQEIAVEEAKSKAEPKEEVARPSV